MSKTLSTRYMAINAIIAAVYVVLTITLAPFSYGAIQFRLSEIFMLLPFYNKNYSWGLILGCAIANMFSPMGIVDVIFGTTATALVCLAFTKINNEFLAVLIASIINGVVVGTMLVTVLNFPLVTAYIYTAISEAIVLTIGVVAFRILFTNSKFKNLILNA